MPKVNVNLYIQQAHLALIENKINASACGTLPSKTIKYRFARGR